MNNYRIHGMTFSCDLNLDDYLPEAGQADLIQCRATEVDPDAIPGWSAAEEIEFTMHDQPCVFRLRHKHNDPRTISRWQLSIDEGLCYLGDVNSGDIQYLVAKESYRTRLSFWLIHATLPFQTALLLGGFWLHAAAVEINGRALIITGPSQAGKSTLARALVKHGARLLADDKLRLVLRDGIVTAVPSHPRNRASRARQELGERLPFASDILEVCGVVRLHRSNIELEPAIAGIKGFDVLKEMQSNKLFELLPPSKEDLLIQTAIVTTVTVVTMSIPNDEARLDNVVDTIFAYPWLKNTA